MQKRSPWKLISTKTVYQNPWIKVREDKVIRPDKRKGIHAVIEVKEGVTILPVDTAFNVYLTQEYHYAIGDTSIEAISGGIEKNETKEKTAQRELKEEAGITCTKLTYLGLINPFTTVVKAPDYLFIAEGLSFSQPHPEGTEKIEIIKLPLKEAIQMALDSTITHGATVAVILKAKEYFENKF